MSAHHHGTGWLGVLALGFLAGCANEPVDDLDHREQRIAGGTEDKGESAVVLVEGKGEGAASTCSGVLLLPDLVLTAAHCVTGFAGAVDCESTVIPPALAPDEFRVSAGANLAEAPDPEFPFVGVSAIHLAAEPGAALCGNDLALLALDAPLGRTLIATANVSQAPSADSPVTAAGYGAQHASGTGERVRRTRELSVICSGQACKGAEIPGAAGGAGTAPPPVLPGEFLASDGPCAGDSGGPALQVGVVVGILSRGLEGCRAPVFVGVDERVAALVRDHASATKQPTPDWANPSEPGADDDPTLGAGGEAEPNSASESDGSVDDAPADHSGCTIARSRPSSSIWLASVLLALAALVLRRRRWPEGTSPRQPLGARAALIGTCLLVSGCKNEVLDTEGRRFSVNCADQACSLVPLDGGAALSLAQDGRLLRACEGAASHDPRTCRTLTCTSDRDCGGFAGDRFSCVSGLCQARERAISEDDRLALCLAGTGPWSGTLAQRRRALLARSCAPPCTMPAQCRQP